MNTIEDFINAYVADLTWDESEGEEVLDLLLTRLTCDFLSCLFEFNLEQTGIIKERLQEAVLVRYGELESEVYQASSSAELLENAKLFAEFTRVFHEYNLDLPINLFAMLPVIGDGLKLAVDVDEGFILQTDNTTYTIVEFE